MPRYANVRQLGSGRWQGRYVGPDGSRHTKLFDSAKAASDWVTEQKESISGGAWINPHDGRTPFRVWLAEWTAARLDVRASTKARDDSIARNHVLPTFGDRPLADIAQGDVRAWVVKLSGAGLAPATVQKAYNVFGSVMAAAVDARLIQLSPCYAINLSRVSRQEMRFLTPAEIARLVDAMPERYTALALVGCYGGLRIGELAGLERRHVDASRSRIIVQQTASEVRGVVHITEPKTASGRRAVPLPRSVMATLLDHLDDHTAGEPTAPVFPSPAGHRLRVPTWRRRVWLPAIKKAGLAPLRVHDMRHTAIALWIHAGANDLQVMRRAGHSSVSFTKDCYGHLFEDSDDTLNDALEGLIAPVPAVASGEGFAPVVPLRRNL